MSLKNITEVADKINKIILDDNLEKIIEMTYSYYKIDENTFYNITLFEEFSWIFYNSKKNIDFELLRKKTDKKLENNISNFLKLIENLKQDALDTKWKILYKSLIYTKKILQITKLWLIFELEKTWYKSKLTKKEKLNIISEIEKIEEENFWLKIKNNLSEIKLIHDFLFWLFIETKSKLSNWEQIFFLKYINTLNKYLDKNNLPVTKIKKKKNRLEFWNKEISRDKYVEIFNYILSEIYNLPQKAIITDASSIYDWEKFLEIPNKSTHKQLIIKRVLELIVHEIESHYINWYNNKILLWEFRWARNLEKEEWLAKSMESFLFWDNEKHAVFVPTYMAKILFSEIYDWNEFYKFIEIYNKMHKLRRHPINEFLRQKRNYSLELKWGQHKDISYWRWMIKTLNYINKGWDFSLLFMWKVWFEDLDKIWDLYLKNKTNILFPIFIGDIIALYLQSKEKWEIFELNIGFLVNFLEKKYKLKWIENFNLEKNISNKMEKIKKLLKLIDKIIDYENK